MQLAVDMHDDIIYYLQISLPVIISQPLDRDACMWIHMVLACHAWITSWPSVCNTITCDILVKLYPFTFHFPLSSSYPFSLHLIRLLRYILISIGPLISYVTKEYQHFDISYHLHHYQATKKRITTQPAPNQPSKLNWTFPRPLFDSFIQYEGRTKPSIIL